MIMDSNKQEEDECQPTPREEIKAYRDRLSSVEMGGVSGDIKNESSLNTYVVANNANSYFSLGVPIQQEITG